MIVNRETARENGGGMKMDEHLDRLIDAIVEKTGKDREGVERVVGGLTQIMGATGRFVGATRFAGRLIARGWRGGKPIVERFRRFLAKRTLDPPWMMAPPEAKNKGKGGRWKVRGITRQATRKRGVMSREHTASFQQHTDRHVSTVPLLPSTGRTLTNRFGKRAAEPKRSGNPWLAPALRKSFHSRYSLE
jgi:hypothetical protein